MSLKEAIEQIAQELAKYGVKHEVHKTIVADIYDRVNAIRDEKIEKAHELLSRIESVAGFPFNDELQAQHIRVTAFINDHNGE